MGFNTNGVRFLALCLVLPVMLIGRLNAQSDETRETKTTVRASVPADDNLALSLLSPTEGMAVIGAALETRAQGRTRLDCSHLVHNVYERAGFPYTYVSSSDLYAGADDFQRVTHPQAGDLVVWPGHVGIVVNPSQSTFYSALRSGRGVESYISPYWRRRGTPRFYRYTRAEAPRNSNVRVQVASSIPESLPVSMIVNQPAAPVDPATIESSIPQELVISSAKPQAREVAQAILAALRAPQSLHVTDVFNLPHPLVVFNNLDVKNVKLHGNRGSAQVRVATSLSVSGGEANMKPRQETQTWTLLRRDQKSWSLLVPQDEIFASPDTAVKMLSRQLVSVADGGVSSANHLQKAQLAQMLNAILSQ